MNPNFFFNVFLRDILAFILIIERLEKAFMHELIFNWYEMNLKIIILCALPFKSKHAFI